MNKKADQSEAPIKSTEHSSSKKQIITSFLIFAFLVIATILVVIYGRGYRFFINNNVPKISKTGILSITSIPPKAQVYVDGHLASATNSSITLTPKKYTVRVSKDGYNDWQKDFELKAEEVSGDEALLLPKSPTLQSISTFGVEEALIDPSGTKLAFKIASQSARKNGIYVFDMTARSLPILQGQSSANQIVDDTVDRFSEAVLSWSPDSREILASISAAVEEALPIDPSITPNPEVPIEETIPAFVTYYSLKSDGFNESPQDITTSISETENLWKSLSQNREKARMKSLKQNVSKFATKHFSILAWSPDDRKILYRASTSAQMPVFLTPRRIGNNLLYERRDLEKGAIYVYNIVEDVNTRIVGATEAAEETPYITWFPDSEHLVYVRDKKIQIVEHDGANMTTIYAGPFEGQYVYPWPDGSKIVILTNLGNPTVSPTLYTIGLK